MTTRKQQKNNSDKLNSLQRKKNDIKLQLSRFNDFIINPENSCRIREISSRLTKVKTLLDEFTSAQDQIDDLFIQLSLVTEQDRIEKEQEIIEFENTFYDIIARAEEIIDKSMPSNVPLTNTNADFLPFGAQPQFSSPPVQIKRSLPLPTINVPKFDGTFDKWANFRDTFRACVMQNEEYSGTYKLYLLRGYLEGAAARSIEYLDTNDANFEIAWDILIQRFDNKKSIIRSHIQKIVELPNVVRGSPTSLRNFNDELKSNYMAVQKYDDSANQWGSLLIYILCEKLDIASKQEWEIKTKDITKPSVKEFLEFISDRCKTLESVATASSSTKSQSKTVVAHKTQVNITTSNINTHCSFCKKSDHAIYECKTFLKLNTAERLNEIKRIKACTNCLKLGHFSVDCKSGSCRYCRKRHNSLLHFFEAPSASSNGQRDHQAKKGSGNNTVPALGFTTSENPNTANTCVERDSLSNYSGQDFTVYTPKHYFSEFNILGTASLYIFDINNRPIVCRALLDNGAQNNFITKEFLNKLQLKTSKIKHTISGIHSISIPLSQAVKATIKSRVSNYQESLDFLVLDKITDHVPQRNFDITQIHLPTNIQLADPNFNVSSPIQILLNVNVFYRILLMDQINLGPNKPVCQNSKLGWIISGSYTNNNTHSITYCNLSYNGLNLERQMESFWMIEECPQKIVKYSHEEQQCESHFVNNTRRLSSGKFSVRLPFRDNREKLGQSKTSAVERFQGLERKLAKNPAIKERYCEFMREYIHLQHMTPIIDLESSVSHFYLPHHCIVKESSMTTKLRVVFDASAKSSTNLSLNDTLMVGPQIQDSVFNILLRFRIHPVVFISDVEKMYRCIEVNEADRDYQRIVWRFDPADELTHFRLNTVTYGTSSASFLATRCLKQLAIENLDSAQASNSIQNNFYMDDWLDGSDDVQSALVLANQVNDILKSAQFNLRQWRSNKEEFLTHFSSQGASDHFVITDNNSTKTLGIIWNPREDIFEYSVNLVLPTINTKRAMLSVISQIYDPLGLLGPIIVVGKIILQRLWLCKIDWDKIIPTSELSLWNQFVKKLHKIQDLRIERHFLLIQYVDVQIHVFSDASEDAYGACVYFRSVDIQGNILVRLVCAKSRVAPLQKLTLPRLELCGASLAAKLTRSIYSALQLNVDRIVFWCDSQITLSWLSLHPSRLKTFVSNRVAQIQRDTDGLKGEWRYVPSKLNPADFISRGLFADETDFLSMWFNGPHWLSKTADYWPSQAAYCKQDDLPELKKTSDEFFSLMSNAVLDVDYDFTTRFSKFMSLIRTIAYILRFYENCKRKREDRVYGDLKQEELNRAEIRIIKFVQKLSFANELKFLSKSQPLPANSKLRCLDPFLDQNELIRVGGRLKHADLHFEIKHPWVLPSNHHFTKLVIRYVHDENLHAGPQSTLSLIRNRFWPLRGRQIVRDTLKKCIRCFKVHPQFIDQKMAQLPKQRVNPAFPFITCGIDYAGPYTIKDSKLRNRKFIKCYVCVFICFVTKAVHLELVSELSSDGFLNMFKRFIARRGLCTDVFSDNATNFTGANNSLQDVIKLANDKKFRDFLLKNKIQWHFIPAKSPHFGGLHESAVRLMKHHLKRVLTSIQLTYEDFYTLLCQVESIVNSRPLIPLTEDPEDLTVLTPGHFLIGRPLLAIPELPESPPASATSRYKHLKYLIHQFWNKWSTSYLHALQQRSKWQIERNHELMKIGTLVMIQDDNTPPLDWKIGRITELHPGSDGLVRVVKIKTSNNNELTRAVTKICVLPIDV